MTRKLLSLLLGVVVTVGCLEVVLVLSYQGFVFVQKRRNHASIEASDNEVRVLCIGESTTAVAGDASGRMLVSGTAYPAQLEQILNSSQDTHTFRVLNNGIMGGTTSTSMDLLDATLPTLQPHVIVAMMGIKDTPDERLVSASTIPPWLLSFRTVQLTVWLLEGAELRDNAVALNIETVDDLPEWLQYRRGPLQTHVREVRALDHPETLDTLKIAIYFWTIGRHGRASALLAETIAEAGLGHNVLAHVHASGGRLNEALAVLDRAIADYPEEASYYIVKAELLMEAALLDDAQSVLDAANAASAGFAAQHLMRQHLAIAQADLYRRMGDPRAALALLQRLEVRHAGPLQSLFPALHMRKHGAMGQAHMALEAWGLAEKHLLEAIAASPYQHAHVWLLSKVYRQTGQLEKEEALRLELLKSTGRIAEYFELAKLFRLSGDADRIPELLAHAVENTPSLRSNYQHLYSVAQNHGISLVIMQYPSFGLEELQWYAPAAPGVTFIDNQHVFASDPDRYFFEPTYPNSFSHYTHDGARVLADQVANTILSLYSDDTEPAP